MEQGGVDQLAGRIHALLGEKLGVRGATLEKRFRKAGRLVPKRAREPIQSLIEAQALAANPKMATRIDTEAVSAAYDVAARELGEVDRGADLSRKRFNLAALVSLQILIVAIAFVAIMRWRGYL